MGLGRRSSKKTKLASPVYRLLLDFEEPLQGPFQVARRFSATPVHRLAREPCQFDPGHRLVRGIPDAPPFVIGVVRAGKKILGQPYFFQLVIIIFEAAVGRQAFKQCVAEGLAGPAGQACYAGPYVCPLEAPSPVGAPCSCPTNNQTRSYGTTR